MPNRTWTRVSGVDRNGTYFVGIYNVSSEREARYWLWFENRRWVRVRLHGLRYEPLGPGDRECPFPPREMAA